MCSKKLFDGLYLTISKMYGIHDIKLNNESQNLPFKRNVSFNNPMYIWYLRLGYINLKWTDRLVKKDPLSSLTIQPLPYCSSCLEENYQNALFDKE